MALGAKKKGGILGWAFGLLIETGIVLVMIYVVRQIPYVGPWANKALNG